MDPASPFPGDESDPTTLPTTLNAPTQQMTSRGVYVDNLSTSAAAIVTCMSGDDGLADTADDVSGEECEAPAVSSVLEILPFFDVQSTFVARWTESEPENPVDATNEELQTGNAHSRGLAKLAGDGVGQSTVHSLIEGGNIGLIGTVSIGYDKQNLQGDVWVIASDEDVTPPPSGNTTVSGTISSEGGTSDAAVVSVSGGSASCTKPTNSTFWCEITGDSATVTVSNYYKSNTDLIACSADLETDSANIGSSATSNWTKFLLPVDGGTGFSITIKKSPC
jgi:hypothetical protein